MSTRWSLCPPAAYGTDDPAPGCSGRDFPCIWRDSANRMLEETAVKGLTALVPGSVCAAALGRGWPDDLDGQVRCLDEGTRALGLAYCCASWPVDAENAALKAELGDQADPGPGSPEAPTACAAAGHDRNLESFASYRSKTRADFDGDAVAAGLARVPGAPPVVGLVSGPLTWSIRVRSGAPLQDAVDAASDLASARIRALAGCGVERVVVVESADAGNRLDAELAFEAHRPILRAAQHLRTDVLLVTTASGAASPASLGYRLWASPNGCADGLAYLPAAAFCSAEALARSIGRRRAQLGAAEAVVTAPLGAGVDPDLVRSAAVRVADLERGGLA